ncbi:MAG: BrnT family toxin [Cellulomonadaceae bacterium]|jgi:uncharacterized DUF497 family protein|nr:BrnT family toxin [Cellulomonadaceae bacterium]
MVGRSIIVAGDAPYEQKFEWDKAKSDTCLEERGFDFNHAASVWEDPNRVSFHSPRPHSTESRTLSIGKIDDKLYAVVTTPRGDSLRIMSARRVSKPREVGVYGKANSGN